jgi:hypothetical protein
MALVTQTKDTRSLLRRVAHAYPEKRITGATLQVYQDELSDIPVPLLERVVSHVIRTSVWFPRVSELRRTAEQLAGTSDFSNLPEVGQDSLTLAALQLEGRFFQQGEFEAQNWLELARQLERIGRSYQADELRRKAQHLQLMKVAVEKGEEYPSQQERKRYAAWDSTGDLDG